jgi:primosomal protein N'
MSVIRVLIPQAQLPLLDYHYKSDVELAIGQCVIVPLRSKHRVGIVTAISPTDQHSEVLKDAIEVIDFKISRDMIDFIMKASKYYAVDPGSIAKLVIPFDTLLIT